MGRGGSRWEMNGWVQGLAGGRSTRLIVLRWVELRLFGHASKASINWCKGSRAKWAVMSTFKALQGVCLCSFPLQCIPFVHYYDIKQFSWELHIQYSIAIISQNSYLLEMWGLAHNSTLWEGRDDWSSIINLTHVYPAIIRDLLVSSLTDCIPGKTGEVQL